MNSTIELLAPRYDIAWYPWAVQYFFMIAVSYASTGIRQKSLAAYRASGANRLR